ncbi:MAG: hypothetical protein AB7G37_03765 [Solirubrobacteraceae bacterium]
MPSVASTPIAFVRGDGTRYRAVVQRFDGVILELDGGGYNRIGGPVDRVPHDLAHLVVEDRLGLAAGLWGVIAAGGLFGHTKVVAGRQPPHAARRGQAVVDAAGDELSRAEMLVRAVADADRDGRPRDVSGLRAAVGPRWWTDAVTADALAAACRGLREAAVAWDALRPGAELAVSWDHPAPPGLAGGGQRRGRPRR